ncbi:MAG: hypothetical protein CMK23_05290 [Porticoccaceae bacterium]|nr:hypothetical protein [Porticoccaceae bacterium]|tara:strand:- start:4100 stop:4318 length:219 start_codon:yes stop_codon:yes gene_type:complete
MTDTKILRDKLLNRLVVLVEEDELSPSMVSAMTNFLKTFPPFEELEDLPTAKKISESLKKYQNVMPFDQGSA